MRQIFSIARRLEAGAGTLLVVMLLGLSGCSPGIPSDCPPDMDCNEPVPPAPLVRPEHVTAQVGAPVTLTAVPGNMSADQVTWQWYRSSDDGAHYVAIAGATSAVLSIASVSLADDATTFQVIARSNGLSGNAVSRLAVSASPGVVYADGEFAPADWVAAVLADGVVSAPAHTEQLVATGGHPGAYRQMAVQLDPQATRETVGFTSQAGTYEPRTQGAVYVIDYSEDGVLLETSFSKSARSALLLDQAGRRYFAAPAGSHGNLSMAWDVGQDTPSLHAEDFTLLDGPACQPGESCPDFTAAGATMRFGYWRIASGPAGATVSHGIDNWKVTVWKR